MSRGHDRERAVVKEYRDQNWFAMRAPGSLGTVDVIAMAATVTGSVAHFIEVKSTAGGPYERFGPADRKALSEAAKLAGAEAWLCWWPSRGKAKWIPEYDWPA